jgi:hypothetical protein
MTHTQQANRPENHIRPEWADCKTITRIFGIGKSTLYRLADEGKCKSSSLRERGKLRGKRLFSCDSVAAYIESMVTGGEEEAP